MKTRRTRLGGAARAGLIMTALCLLCPAAARAQWSQPDAGGNTNYPNGRVGVGTDAPSSKVAVVAGFDGDGVRVSGSTVSPGFGLLDGSTVRGFLGLARANTAWSFSAVPGDVVLRADTGRRRAPPR